jgi:hypothetical protein
MYLSLKLKEVPVGCIKCALNRANSVTCCITCIFLYPVKINQQMRTLFTIIYLYHCHP